MIDEDRLLSILAEDPDDLATLAVLADHYVDRGDPRGELIQLELAPSTPETVARIAAIKEANLEAWLAPLNVGPLGYDLVRGLVGSVGGEATFIASRWREIERVAPYFHVLELWGAADLEPLRDWSLWPRVRKLVVGNAGKHVRHWGAIGVRPKLAVLVLDAISLQPGDLSEIRTAVPNLRRLELSACRFYQNARDELALFSDVTEA